MVFFPQLAQQDTETEDLVDELFNKAGEEFVITFGKPIPYTSFDGSRTDLQWAEYVKDTVKELSLDNGCTPNM